MSKAKAQGTRHESFLVTELRAAGYEAKRLAEGGSGDEGDVEATLHGTRWVFEAKARQTLNVQATLGKARLKAAGHPVAVVWKRLVPVAGRQIRQPVAGERVVVSLSLQDFFDALQRAYDAGSMRGTTGE